MSQLCKNYQRVRNHTVSICQPLETEDFVVQPNPDVSPPKWHLGHTTWFFETFILKSYQKGYKEFDGSYGFVFNSYYETMGERVLRPQRGNLSRPTVADVMLYRKYVDNAMNELLSRPSSGEIENLVRLGLAHEEQHQELLYSDIKFILGTNPLFPPYNGKMPSAHESGNHKKNLVIINEGIYEIGHDGQGFCFVNEMSRHKVYLRRYKICSHLVTNGEYMEFIKAGGYHDFNYWLAEGWEWVQINAVECPLYWHKINGQWLHYSLGGLLPPNPETPVCHVSYYEAAAYASWKNMRLPNEAEWEIAAGEINWGQRWEWTQSAYLPYPGFKKAEGAIGEYNGKFMVNQMVLRGASEATSPGHSRITYRNFFQPHLQWQFSGIRLADDL
jgi:ergothioneine biosynthesis protein EgtB